MSRDGLTADPSSLGRSEGGDGDGAWRKHPDCPPPREALWQALGWRPDPDALGRLIRLQQELRRWNERLNLTRLVEGDDFWIAQVYDSLWPIGPLLSRAAQTRSVPLEMVDVGTGGGFPGLALAIALPKARLTLVDSVARKVEAVRAMAASLDLGDRITVRCERIERMGRDGACRGCFDLAVARAVASAPVVAEYLVPLLKPTGRALLYRGRWSAQDQQEVERAAQLLRAELEAVQRHELPAGRGLRHAVVLRPLGPCPAAYPRPVGVPAKTPISGARG